MNINKYKAQFEDSEIEQLFRNENQKTYWISLVLVVLVVISLMAFFSLNDYKLFQFTDSFFKLISIRLIFISFSFLTLYFYKKKLSFKFQDRIILIWAFLLVFETFIINWTRPIGFVNFTVTDPLILVGIYFFIPMRLTQKIFTGLFFSTISLTFLFTFDTGMESSQTQMVIISMLAIHILGTLTTWQIDFYKRNSYRSIQIEKEEKEKFSRALDEIKELKGLLPICANCKKIKDDEGYWQRIETYIQDNTLAKFTHTVCCECANELYGKEEWFQEMKKKKGDADC